MRELTKNEQREINGGYCRRYKNYQGSKVSFIQYFSNGTYIVHLNDPYLGTNTTSNKYSYGLGPK